ncbi:MAG: tRNA modification GTPase [Planctomycetota bacterium]|nr:tRNA modification GTPase [Planctomycetota bacterium]
MQLDVNDTIAALASPAGSAARGIVRISGPDVTDALVGLFQSPDNAWRATRAATRFDGALRLSGLSSPLSTSLYLWPNTRSYTGQPMAELHLIGSPPLLEQTQSDLFQRGVRPARAGEFTLRAFLAGRIDLVQAEAVLGIIDAPDHEELEAALQQLAGGLSGPVVDLRDDLIELLADLEAGLDFVDEDIEFVSSENVIDRLLEAHAVLSGIVTRTVDRYRTQSRWRVVLAGLPNAGKSTLFNALSGKNTAIVSHVRGTTRDFLSQETDWNGLSIELIDTAGQEAGSGRFDATGIEQSAQRMRQDSANAADLVVWCIASDLAADERELDHAAFMELSATSANVLLVHTKQDLDPSAIERTHGLAADVRISAATGEGLEQLAAKIAERLEGSRRGDRWMLGSTAARSRQSFEAAADAVAIAIEAAKSRRGDEIVALEIRECLEHLGHVLGETLTDDILDRVFSKFCIGK